MNAHPDSEDECGRTGASYCAELGHVSLLRRLAAHGAFLDQSDNMSRTPLHWAALSGQEEIIAVLLEHGTVDLSRRDQKGIAPLWHAIHKNHHSIARALLDRGASVDMGHQTLECSPLCSTAQYGQFEIVQHLVQSGAEVNRAGNLSDGLYTLHYACENNHEDVVRVLLAAGADPNVCTENERTPLHCAAGAGSAAIVQILLDLKVDVNATHNFRRTPLHDAASYGHAHLIKMLVDAGADMEHGHAHNSTPLHMAAKNEHDCEGTTDCIIELLKLGAAIDSLDESRCTPLYRAAESGPVESVEELLRGGANVDHVDKYGNTALHRAAGRERSETVRRLLEAGADVNKTCSRGETALFAAAAGMCASETVQLLLEHGAVDIPNDEGKTALSRVSFSSVKRLLLQFGNYPEGAGQDVRCCG